MNEKPVGSNSIQEQYKAIKNRKDDYEMKKQQIIDQMKDVLAITNNKAVEKIIGQAIEFVKKG